LGASFLILPIVNVCTSCYNVLVSKNSTEVQTEGDMEMTVKKWISRDKVREMCIRYNYYTRGDCRAYDVMLATAKNLDPEDYVGLLTVANDIYNHSSIQDDAEYSRKDMIEGLVYGLLTECVEMYVEVEEGEVA